MPPEPVAVHDTAVPTVPVAGQLIATAKACALVMVMDAEFDAVFAFASVTVTLTVADPAVVIVVENVEAVAVTFVTPLTDQA